MAQARQAPGTVKKGKKAGKRTSTVKVARRTVFVSKPGPRVSVSWKSIHFEPVEWRTQFRPSAAERQAFSQLPD